jgi:curved DNA-binding protein CbpA
MITHYDVLKVTTNASLTVITEAYNALCKKYHPDNYQDEIKRAKAESVIKRLNESFEILSNEKKRADYDLKLKFIEDTNVILNDEKISPEIKQTDTNEGVLKQINFGKIKDDISQSVENVKTEIQHSIDENITSKVDLNKVKGSIAQSVENTKTLAEKIEHSVHEKIGKIDFDAIKSEIKEKIHTLDSNAEKKSKNDSEIGDDFFQKIVTDTEISVQKIQNNNLNENETKSPKIGNSYTFNLKKKILLFGTMIFLLLKFLPEPVINNDSSLAKLRFYTFLRNNDAMYLLAKRYISDNEKEQKEIGFGLLKNAAVDGNLKAQQEVLYNFIYADDAVKIDTRMCEKLIEYANNTKEYYILSEFYTPYPEHFNNSLISIQASPTYKWSVICDGRDIDEQKYKSFLLKADDSVAWYKLSKFYSCGKNGFEVDKIKSIFYAQKFLNWVIDSNKNNSSSFRMSDNNIADAYVNFAVIYYNLGDIVLSHDYYDKAYFYGAKTGMASVPYGSYNFFVQNNVYCK